MDPVRTRPKGTRDNAGSCTIAAPDTAKANLQKKRITINTWLRVHDIGRSQYYLSKHAGGKPIEDKVSVDMTDKIKAAILRHAV